MKKTPEHHNGIRLLSCLTALCVGLAGCGGSKPAGAPKGAPEKAETPSGGGGDVEAAVPVQVATAIVGNIDHRIVADAVLYPVNQANVTPKISSPVRRMLVNRGDHVRVGQPIAELEARDLASAAEEAKGQFDQAQASYQTVSGATLPEDKTRAQADVNSTRQGLEAAQRVYDSRVALAKEGALAQKLVEDAKVALVQAQSAFETAQRHLQSVQQVSATQGLRGAEAQVAAAKAHYQSAETQLSYAIVRSPISGVVADRSVYAGEMAASGNALVSIVDISDLGLLVTKEGVPLNGATKKDDIIAAIRAHRATAN